MHLKHKFFYKKFENLSRKEIHDLFLLRSEVFVVEQNCVYQDIDGRDEKARHVLVKIKTKIIAYARVLQDKDPNYVSIGRIVVSVKERRKGLGRSLLDFILKKIYENEPKRPIKISAQAHLESFYTDQGFKTKSKPYMEDGIPHISMILE
tara:strand:- start:11349 stop:11798 length:450 start_codon:yes stop_codon:yes gene_type:complete